LNRGDEESVISVELSSEGQYQSANREQNRERGCSALEETEKSSSDTAIGYSVLGGFEPVSESHFISCEDP
jgi:hypothetical protein